VTGTVITHQCCSTSISYCVVGSLPLTRWHSGQPAIYQVALWSLWASACCLWKLWLATSRCCSVSPCKLLKYATDVVFGDIDNSTVTDKSKS